MSNPHAHTLKKAVRAQAAAVGALKPILAEWQGAARALAVAPDRAAVFPQYLAVCESFEEQCRVVLTSANTVFTSAARYLEASVPAAGAQSADTASCAAAAEALRATRAALEHIVAAHADIGDVGIAALDGFTQRPLRTRFDVAELGIAILADLMPPSNTVGVLMRRLKFTRPADTYRKFTNAAIAEMVMEANLRLDGQYTIAMAIAKWSLDFTMGITASARRKA